MTRWLVDKLVPDVTSLPRITPGGKDLLVHFAYLLTTIAKLLGPGGMGAVVTDSLLMKQRRI